MKLAIVCVYKASAEHAVLLDTHLRQIARHTTLPYLHYAAPVGLPDPLRARLAAEPAVRLVDLPPTELTSGAEHAYYLEPLTRLAIDEGATQVVTLHLDSFPLRTGWDALLVDALRPEMPLATPRKMNTSCLLFTREFYLEHAPRYCLTPEERHSALAAALLDASVIGHTGAGYMHALARAGLRWLALDLRREQDGFPDAEFIGGSLFHAGGLLSHARVRLPSAPSRLTALDRWLAAAALRGKRLIPPAWRARAKQRVRPDLVAQLEVERSVRLQADFQRGLESFSRDPAGYVARAETLAANLPLGEPRGVALPLS